MAENKLINLKEINELHKSGKVITLLRKIREYQQNVDSVFAGFNAKIEENKKAKIEKETQVENKQETNTEKPVETVKQNPQPEKSFETIMSEKTFEQKAQTTNNNFQRQTRFDNQNRFGNNFRNNQNGFQNKATFPRNNFNQNGYSQNNFRQNGFNQNRFNNGFGQRNQFQNSNSNFQRPFNNNFKDRQFNNFGRPFNNQKPNFNGKNVKSEFSSTKENNFKIFQPTERMPVQAERNYGNKNKSPNRQYDEKKQTKKQQFVRKAVILNEDNEERFTIRKLAKTKKKEVGTIAAPITNAVITTETISVKNLSEKIGKPVPEIIKKLMLLGIMSNINSTIDFDTAELVSTDLGVTLEQKLDKTFEEQLIDNSKQDDGENTEKRPPVVTVMGHVDHGKTSLLDRIRSSSVASGEAGGITQKIGAYSITVDGEKITFIDTPGHAAFTSMRARGAKVTDIAILVVAADDGVMPQTIEAINHIKSANVPMIVAINKMDVVGANPERIKSQLAENGVLPEEWGGDTILVPISAKTGAGFDKLMESILLVAEILELKANPNKMATGTVIEAELDKNRGPIATILVQNGTLKVGDSIMSGITFGKVKAMFDENGKQVKEASPSTAVSVLGFYEVPSSGDQVYAVDEKLSKQVISERIDKIKEERANKTSGVSLDDFMNKVNEGKLKSLNIIIKADVQGSVEALVQTLTAINNEEVKVTCIHSAVGNVTESDLVLAKASSAIIINFNLKVLSKIQTMADNMGVEIKEYKVIYDIVEDITNSINGMMTVKYEQVTTGHAEVRMVFKLSSSGLVAGSYVTDGKIIRKGCARLIREGEVIADTDIVALKIVKDDKSEVPAGFECGIKLLEVPNLKEGDIIECYENIPIKRS